MGLRCRPGNCQLWDRHGWSEGYDNNIIFRVVAIEDNDDLVCDLSTLFMGFTMSETAVVLLPVDAVAPSASAATGCALASPSSVDAISEVY